ncbi:MAG TPA: hypothetical protein VM841_03570 [Actinomycetota bacterium]|nr:hypothetical protein [Actinomycetota bacterium]
MTWTSDGYDMMLPVPLRAAPAPPPAAPTVAPGGAIPIVPPRGTRSPKVIAVLFAVGGLVGGFIAYGAMTLIELILSFMGSSDSAVPEIAGITVALVGFGFAAYFWLRADRETCVVTVGSQTMTISLPEWSQPMVVPREAVKLVALDDRPMIPFNKNHRFAIEGELPEAVFADALDRHGRNPWEPVPAQVPYQLPQTTPPPDPDASNSDAPEPAEHEAGWATVGSKPVPEPRGRHGYLYSGDGSALPLFLYNEIDIPNMAIVFTREMQLPKRSPGFFLLQRRSIRSSNARKARGLMLRARNGVQAEAALAPWGVVRAPHAGDVLGAGLRPPKPLKGLRAAAFAAMMIVPIVLDFVMRRA